MSATASKCRSCGATIWWARTESNRAIPLNPPHDGGNLAAWENEDGELRCRAGVAADNELPTTSHFSDCPSADVHRRRKA